MLVHIYPVKGTRVPLWTYYHRTYWGLPGVYASHIYGVLRRGHVSTMWSAPFHGKAVAPGIIKRKQSLRIKLPGKVRNNSDWYIMHRVPLKQYDTSLRVACIAVFCTWRKIPISRHTYNPYLSFFKLRSALARDGVCTMLGKVLITLSCINVHQPRVMHLLYVGYDILTCWWAYASRTCIIYLHNFNVLLGTVWCLRVCV